MNAITIRTKGEAEIFISSEPLRPGHLIELDDTRHEPAIDTSLFPGVLPRWHWTSTPCAWSSASAWLVSFGNGHVGVSPRYDLGFALAVRRAGQ
ncbi:TPA: DUF1566 domain-containing protein [Stenotrophomonas maltophilia]|nr:DUF1566 domain-containing protein [Stenotrophomonas maltophilia]